MTLAVAPALALALALDGARAAFAGGDEEQRRAALAALPLEGAALGFLVEAMGDSSWRVRKEAAARAIAWPDGAEAAPALVAALAEPENVGRRNALVDVLVGLAGAAVAALVDGLASAPEHRKLLVDALGRIGDPRGADAVAPLVDDADPNVRVAAAEALGAMGGPAAEAALRRVLGRAAAAGGAAGDVLLALAALDGLNRMAVSLPSSELAQMAAEPTLRGAVLRALGRSGDPQALPELVAGLRAPARTVREAALLALSELHPRLDGAGRALVAETIDAPVHEAIVAALTDGPAALRRAAARVLGLSGRVESVQPLTLALGHPELREAARAALVALGRAGGEALVALAPDLEPRLRAEAYALLPELGLAAGDPRAVLLCTEALDDEEPEAAAAAAVALGELGGREALAPLLRALEAGGAVAQAAAAALGRLGRDHYDEVRILVASRGLGGSDAPYLCRVLALCGRDEDVARLREALGADSAALRRAAAEALGALPSPSTAGLDADEALLFALADESPEVRAAAARSLGAHAPPDVVEPLDRAAADPEPPVRAAAARALGQAAALSADAAQRAAALAALRRLADGDDLAASVPALEALGRTAHHDDDARLFAALAAPDAETVKVAARALGGHRGARAREALFGALGDRRWDVRRAAALALGDHGAEARSLLLARRQVETDALVLEAIEAALGRGA
jgi:HEAT repeat protein